MKKIYTGKSSVHKRGIFVGEPVRKGELIQYIVGKKVKKLPKTKEESLSIPTWFGLSRHIWMDPGKSPFQYLNHSCEPNAAISGTKSLIAIKNIQQDEEVSIDYSMTDSDQLWEMKCECGTTECRGTIRSIHTVPTKVFKHHMPHIPRYFQRVYLRHYVASKLK